MSDPLRDRDSKERPLKTPPSWLLPREPHFFVVSSPAIRRSTELGEVSPMALGRVLNQGDEISFRFVFELADEEEALGLSGTTDFIWEVTPE